MFYLFPMSVNASVDFISTKLKSHAYLILISNMYQALPLAQYKK